MVIPDLSAPETHIQNSNFRRIAIASVTDRFMALLLDFLLVSPIVSLALAGLIRKAKTYFLLDAQSPEGLAFGALVFVCGAVVVVLLQALALYLWQATPGQYFLQLRVISYPQEKKQLGFGQCLVRALGFVANFLMMGIPFLEVLGHPLRRVFNERASDTMVITLKKKYDEGPAEIEQRFVSSWIRLSFLVLALFVAAGVMQSWRSLDEDHRYSRGESGRQCKEIADRELRGNARLDAALSLFVLDEISQECLNKEADASLWGDPVNSQDLAYLAKFLTADRDQQDLYFQRICKQKNSSACFIGTYLKKNGGAELLKEANSELWFTQLLRMEEQYENHDVIASLESIENLQRVPVLKPALEKKYIRSIWALRDSRVRSSGRSPASVSKKAWVEEFKDRYGIE